MSRKVSVSTCSHCMMPKRVRPYTLCKDGANLFDGRLTFPRDLTGSSLFATRIDPAPTTRLTAVPALSVFREPGTQLFPERVRYIDIRTPLWGIRTPLWGIRTPLWGIRTPLWGIRTPLWGIRTPLWGIRTLLWGIVYTIHLV